MSANARKHPEIPWSSDPPTNPLDDHQAPDKRFLVLAFYGGNNLFFVLICILQYIAVIYTNSIQFQYHHARYISYRRTLTMPVYSAR